MSNALINELRHGKLRPGLRTDAADEIERLRKALNDIRHHVEISVPSGYKLSGVWNIAHRALFTGHSEEK